MKSSSPSSVILLLRALNKNLNDNRHENECDSSNFARLFEPLILNKKRPKTEEEVSASVKQEIIELFEVVKSEHAIDEVVRISKELATRNEPQSMRLLFVLFKLSLNVTDSNNNNDDDDDDVKDAVSAITTERWHSVVVVEDEMLRSDFNKTKAIVENQTYSAYPTRNSQIAVNLLLQCTPSDALRKLFPQYCERLENGVLKKKWERLKTIINTCNGDEGQKSMMMCEKSIGIELRGIRELHFIVCNNSSNKLDLFCDCDLLLQCFHENMQAIKCTLMYEAPDVVCAFQETYEPLLLDLFQPFVDCLVRYLLPPVMYRFDEKQQMQTDFYLGMESMFYDDKKQLLRIPLYLDEGGGASETLRAIRNIVLHQRTVLVKSSFFSSPNFVLFHFEIEAFLKRCNFPYNSNCLHLLQGELERALDGHYKPYFSQTCQAMMDYVLLEEHNHHRTKENDNNAFLFSETKPWFVSHAQIEFLTRAKEFYEKVRRYLRISMQFYEYNHFVKQLQAHLVNELEWNIFPKLLSICSPLQYSAGVARALEEIGNVFFFKDRMISHAVGKMFECIDSARQNRKIDVKDLERFRACKLFLNKFESF